MLFVRECHRGQPWKGERHLEGLISTAPVDACFMSTYTLRVSGLVSVAHSEGARWGLPGANEPRSRPSDRDGQYRPTAATWIKTSNNYNLPLNATLGYVTV